MLKKIIMYVVAFASFYAKADYQTVDGIEWRYYASSYRAEVEGISSYHYEPIEVTIPSALGGVPVERIDSHAFRNCDFLLSVVIPGTVEYIYDGAFEDCDRLMSVTIPNSVRWIYGEVFRNCKSLTSVTIPKDAYISGDRVFEGCSSLTHVTVPEGSNHDIPTGMFRDCTSLTSVTFLGNFRTLQSEAFSGCTSLSRITIPSGVYRLGWHAFQNCSSLTSITIPDSVTSIEWGAFEGCSSLTSVKIGSGVTSIGSGAFANCSSIEAFQVSAGNTYFSVRDGMLCDKSGTVLVAGKLGDGEVAIPGGIITIGEGAFKSCGGLYDIMIPESVKSIGNSAFYECRGLTRITIPNSVTNIGTQAFRDCDGLTEVFIPESVTSIGHDAFLLCDNLKTVYLPERLGGVSASSASIIRYRSVLVQFDGNGVALDIDSMKARTQFKIGELPSPKSERMVFRGWWTEKNGGEQIDENTIVQADMILYAHWETVPAPLITSSNGLLFESESSSISISCAMPEATIYYSDTGKTPKENDLYLYTGDFEITGTKTIKAVAMFDGARSEYVTVTINQKEITLEEAIEQNSLEIKMGGDADWTAKFVDSAPVGGQCARSGVIDDDGESWMEVKVSGAGALSFWSKTSCEHDYDDTFTWDRLMIYTNGVEITQWRMDGESDWTKRMLVFAGGENTVKWCYYKDESVSEGKDCAFVDAITWTYKTSSEPLPTLPDSATEEQVALALGGSADAKLAANITDAAEYAAYRAWALGLEGVTPQQVKDSPNAWLSYALDADVLIAAAPKEGDIVIDTFKSTATAGAFEFTVKINGIEVGDNAFEANIRKVFDIEGAEKLDMGDARWNMSNVEVNAAASVNGNVKFTVTPKMEGGEKPNSFFFRVKMK